MAKPDITIMSLDIATVTGVALWRIRDHESAIRTFSVKVTGGSHEEKAVNAGPIFRELFREHRPHFISLEAPRKDVQQHEKVEKQFSLPTGEQRQPEMTINPASVILPNQLTGAILGQIGICKLPWCTIPELTWRKSFLGFARKKGWSRPDYKKAARQRCELLGVNVTNDDMADAVGVLWATQADGIFQTFLDDYRKAEAAQRTAA